MSERYLDKFIKDDLAAKMVFLAGPRQVGKTTLAERVRKEYERSVYLCWDRAADRKRILSADWPSNNALIVLDELHKYRFWKRWIKGEYDHHRSRHRFLVTGSARLDHFRKGGDSLQGRYHHYRLHPFSVAELSGMPPPAGIVPGAPLPVPSRGDAQVLPALLRYGGFPEPILAQNDRVYRRWRKERTERFVREDIRDLENVRDLSSIQLLTDMLPERTASVLSLNSLREDLDVSHRAVSHWISVLESLYYIYRVPPYAKNNVRALKKAPKAYMWDWSLVPDPGARFENLIASHLNKFCHFLTDTEGYSVELRYLRDVTGREADFLVVADGKPWFAVEAKLSDTSPSPHLGYFKAHIGIPHLFQVVLDGADDRMAGNVRIISADRFLAGLA